MFPIHVVVEAEAVCWVGGHIPVGIFRGNIEGWSQQSCFISFQTWSWGLDVHVETLFRAGAVAAGPSVGCIFSVPGGSTMSRPIKLFGFILGEHTDGVLFKAAVKLTYG